MNNKFYYAKLFYVLGIVFTVFSFFISVNKDLTILHYILPVGIFGIIMTFTMSFYLFFISIYYSINKKKLEYDISELLLEITEMFVKKKHKGIVNEEEDLYEPFIEELSKKYFKSNQIISDNKKLVDILVSPIPHKTGIEIKRIGSYPYHIGGVEAKNNSLCNKGYITEEFHEELLNIYRDSIGNENRSCLSGQSQIEDIFKLVKWIKNNELEFGYSIAVVNNNLEKYKSTLKKMMIKISQFKKIDYCIKFKLINNEYCIGIVCLHQTR